MDILSSILNGLKDLGKEVIKGIIGAPSETIQTATEQISGDEKTPEEVAKEQSEEKKKEEKVKMNLHEQAQMLGVSEEKTELSEEELKAKEEEEKKEEELPPLEMPKGKTTGMIGVKRAQTQIEDKQGYRG